ncbi:uncharacterized protein LOC142332794 [Lycorma delicatula]|uniref:uncharacterized protein LOC142332794 n=1 Tax=Lycorma delicatula TaxID=130591 RepID=UPI003F5145C6
MPTSAHGDDEVESGRFIQNIKHKSTNDRKFDALSSNELEFTLEFFIHQSQLAYFKSEINDLQNQRFISKQSKLSSLDPFLDYKGSLRVGGRLEHSNLSFDKKHQLILHPHANITRLINHSEHLRLLHAGLQLTHSSLCHRFWIVNAKIAIHSIVRKCLKCFRFNADNQSQQLGQLPSSRITPSRAFSSCAIDFGGPNMIRHGGQKSKILSKACIALFICLVTKAIHLEPVSDLTTESFVAALKQFIARRACLNSHPLFAISTDLKDPEPLTPGHFLIGSPLTSFPDPDFSETPENRLGRWQLLQKFIQVIWKRWSKDYLHQLQQRNKWRFPNRNLCEGDLVLICDDNTSPLFWKSGIATHAFMGSDNLVRVVATRTSNGVFRRPIHKLCLLPLSDN